MNKEPIYTQEDFDKAEKLMFKMTEEMMEAQKKRIIEKIEKKYANGFSISNNSIFAKNEIINLIKEDD